MLIQRMMISIILSLVLVHQSMADFRTGIIACYDIVGLEQKDFKLKFSDQVKFAPEKMEMKTSYFILNNANKDVIGQHLSFTVKRKRTNCGETLDVFMHLEKPGIKSNYFVSFFYGEYLVEHYIIKPSAEGQATVYGIKGRATLKILSKRFEGELTKPKSQESLVLPDLEETSGSGAYVLTFMNYGKEGRSHILPDPKIKLKLPQMAIFKMTLVDTEGNPIKGVSPIIDLVKIEVALKPKLKNKLYYSTGFKNHNVEIKILGADKKEISKATYPLTQAKFGDAATSKSDFNLMGVELTEVNDDTLTLPDGYTTNAFQFMKTTQTLLKCKVQSKDAFVIKFKLGALDLVSESRCSGATSEKQDILYYSPCTDKDAGNCKG